MIDFFKEISCNCGNPKVPHLSAQLFEFDLFLKSIFPSFIDIDADDILKQLGKKG